MRHENWPTLLSEHLRDAPAFEWGKSDCVLWCAAWITKATGREFPAVDYTTSDGAYQYLTSLGFQTPADLADANLPRINVSYAQRGDIIQHPDGALGICDGTWSYFLTIEGKTRFPTLQCLAAWRV